MLIEAGEIIIGLVPNGGAENGNCTNCDQTAFYTLIITALFGYARTMPLCAHHFLDLKGHCPEIRQLEALPAQI